jgi:hypothetical protein
VGLIPKGFTSLVHISRAHLYTTPPCHASSSQVCFLTDFRLSWSTSYLEGDQVPHVHTTSPPRPLRDLTHHPWSPSLWSPSDTCLTPWSPSVLWQYVLDHTMVRAHYMRSWALVDALSSLPLELIDALITLLPWLATSDGETGADGLRALRALRLLRLMRLLRLLKLQRYISTLEDSLDVSLQFLHLAKVVCGLVYLTHLLGCTWFYLAYSSDAEVTWLSEYNHGVALDAGIWVQVRSPNRRHPKLVTPGYGHGCTYSLTL